MSAAHTPGPWRVTGDGYIAAINGGFVPFRTPFRQDAFIDGNTRSDHSEETLKANARLIAAAPELLDALINARNVLTLAINKFGDGSDDDNDSRDEVLSVITMADAAFSKATGSAA